MVGYLFTLLELYERGRKKKKKKKRETLFPYFRIFEKLCHCKGRRQDKRKNEIQHHRYDRRVSKQLCIS